MATLTQDDLKKLMATGLTIPQIIRMSPTQIQSALTGQNLPLSAYGRDPFTGGALRNPVGGVAGYPIKAGGGIAVRGSTPVTPSSTLFKTLGINPNAIGSKIGEVLSGVGKAAGNVAHEVVNIANGKGRQAAGGGRAPAKTGPAAGTAGMPDVFQADPYSAPTLEYRDFTDQARGQVGDIYNPRYAAIDAAMQRAQEQYGRSKQVVGGLYENLAKSMAQTAEDTKARYGQAAQEQQARTQQTQADVGQTYSSTQNQEAALLQQLGQQEAARQVLSDNSADSAYQQSQVQREGQAQLANNTMQGNAQQDYLANVGQAQQTGGIVAQQDLLNQLGATNAGYEQDRFNLQGDQAQAALQLAQQLSDRDYQAQAQNAQLGAQAYGINNQNAQFSSQQEWDRYNQQQALRLQMQQAAQQQANSDRDFNLNQSKYATDLATAQAQLRLDQQKQASQQGYQGLDVNDQDPVSRTMSQITSATGGDQSTAKQYLDFVQQATNAFAANGLDAASIIGSQFSFVSEIGRQAQAKGLNPIVAQAAAAAVWQNLLKGQAK